METQLCQATPSPLRGGDTLPPLAINPAGSSPHRQVKRNRRGPLANAEPSPVSRTREPATAGAKSHGSSSVGQGGDANPHGEPHGHRAERTGCHGGRMWLGLPSSPG